MVAFRVNSVQHETPLSFPSPQKEHLTSQPSTRYLLLRGRPGRTKEVLHLSPATPATIPPPSHSDAYAEKDQLVELLLPYIQHQQTKRNPAQTLLGCKKHR